MTICGHITLGLIRDEVRLCELESSGSRGEVSHMDFVVLLATDHSVAQSPSSHYILALVLLVWLWLLPSPRGRGPLDLSVR